MPQVSPDGATLYCLCNGRVVARDLGSGVAVVAAACAAGARDDITAFAVAPGSGRLATAARSQLFKLWPAAAPGGGGAGALDGAAAAAVGGEADGAPAAAPAEALATWRAHGAPVGVVAFDASGALLASGGADRTVCVYDTRRAVATHALRGHEGVISCVAFAPGAARLVSGALRLRTRAQRLLSAGTPTRAGAEGGGLRVWDLASSSCAAELRGHDSAVTAALWAPAVRAIVSVARDGMVHVWGETGGGSGGWELALAHPVYEGIEDAVALSPQAAGGGAVLDGDGDTPMDGEGAAPLQKKPRRASAPLSTAEAPRFEFVTVGERGLVRAWALTPRAVAVTAGRVGAGSARRFAVTPRATHASADVTGVGATLAAPAAARAAGAPGGAAAAAPLPAWGQLSRVVARAGGWLLVAAGDATVYCVRARDLTVAGRVVGTLGEVIDVKWVPAAPGPSAPGGRVLLACNSEHARVVDVASLDCTLLRGHSGIVLAVDASPDGRFAATASRDGTVRLWCLRSNACVGVGEGHADAVAAVAWPSRAAHFARDASPWLVTGSRDRTVKVWHVLPAMRAAAGEGAGSSAAPVPVRAVATASAHGKDINALAVAPNDSIVASAGADKAVKLWSVTVSGGAATLALVATLSGHKRGVWSVAFSPVDQVLASASGDQTIRLWCTRTHACLGTLEGHGASVLCVRFLRAGMQVRA